MLESICYKDQHRKRQSLWTTPIISQITRENYVIIELRLKDGWKPNAIAKKELNCSGEYRAKHHQEGHDAAVQWQGIPLQGKDRLEGLPGKRASQLPDIRSLGEASFLAICGEALS